MFAYIKGKVCERGESSVVLETGGIGFELFCSARTLSFAESKRDSVITLYTYLKTGDDGMTLFGFSAKEEKAMFLKLIAVSGVGPKVALAILTGISPKDLAVCIASKDVKRLTAVKGVGKKTAERILLELKEQVSAEFAAPDAAGEDYLQEELAGDAVMALMALGFNRAESVKLAAAAIAKGAVGTEEILTAALRNM